MESSVIERARALFAEGRGGEALSLLARLTEPERAAHADQLAALVEPTVATRQSFGACYADLFEATEPDKPRVRSAAHALGKLHLPRAALSLASFVFDRDDAAIAPDRARFHLALGQLEEAVKAADLVLAGMLRIRMPIGRFVKQAVVRPPEELLRYSRAEIARMPELREAIVVRWQALRRAGRKNEAVDMRALCIRYWPERVSVWEAAGNHALDDVQPDLALDYFARALELDPTSTVALAGKAIAHEMRKEWSAALELRREVAELEGAFTREDSASLHRVLRYAANLGRLGRWLEASPHFHRAARLGAFSKAPHERPALLRAFGRELYAPAVLAVFAREGGVPDAPALRMALGDAKRLAALAGRMAVESQPPHARALATGMCALQAGELGEAYRAFDEADEVRDDDIVASQLLASTALELGMDDAPSAAEFASRLARRALAAGATGEPRFYAALALAREDGGEALRGHMDEPFASLLSELDRGPLELGALARLAERWCRRPAELEALHAWTALRAASVALGQPPGLPALACARLRALSE